MRVNIVFGLYSDLTLMLQLHHHHDHIVFGCHEKYLCGSIVKIFYLLLVLIWCCVSNHSLCINDFFLM